MGTSSANPDKLDSYSTGGLDLVETLRTRSNAVTDALATLRASSSHHVPALGDADAQLSDLVGDWQHLDEFVGDVAQGFFAANQTVGPRSLVVTVDDGVLATLGEIGYADRDEAIDAANAMADELERLQAEGATAEEMDSFVEMATRGQYDPAFAVTFSERVGVDGYADATAMIRSAYLNDDRDLDDAIPQVGVLGGLLTTALDTLPGIDDADRHDSSNADLPADQRLSAEFVHELTTGYQPEDNGGPGENPWGYTGEDDLSVLVSLTDPPTDVAIDIAENRMKPMIENGSPSQYSLWGDEYRDPVVNYATMLGRNDDASAGWLSGDGNIELVLEQYGVDMLDGGEALAGVVEAGLTNPDMRMDIPGAPSYAEGGLVREQLMNRAIEFIGSQDGAFDIGNEHLYDALASGVESNMNVVDGRINGGWSADADGNYTYNGGDDLADTMYFLSDVMADEQAAGRIRTATLDYVRDDLSGLPVDEDGRMPRDQVIEPGRLLGTVLEADITAATEAFGDEQDLATQRGKLLDLAIGWVPVVSDVHDIAGTAGNASAGDQVFSPDSDQFRDNLLEAALGTQGFIEDLDIHADNRDNMKAAASDVRNAIAQS